MSTPFWCRLGLHDDRMDPDTLKKEKHPNRFMAAHGVMITTYIYYCIRCGREIRTESQAW